jgi:hypothetical protein
MGGVMAKMLQSAASNNSLIRSIFKPRTNEEFNEIKVECNKTMHDNTGMPMKKIIKLLDKYNVQYDKSRTNDIKVLGVGTLKFKMDPSTTR